MIYQETQIKSLDRAFQTIKDALEFLGDPEHSAMDKKEYLRVHSKQLEWAREKIGVI